MLKLYTEKGNKEKIAAIIDEMKPYKGIRLRPGQWGEDNRDWYVDKQHNTISQSMSSIKFVSKKAVRELYTISQQREAWMGTEYVKTKEKDPDGNPVYEQRSFSAPLDCFTNVLRALQMNSSLDTRQIGILIGLGYFSAFGKNKKLMNVYTAFFEGPNKLTKTIKSFNKRLTAIREYEKMQPDESLPCFEQLRIENENIGLCFSSFPTEPFNLFFVQELDTQYGVKVKLYSVQRGTSGTMKLRKAAYENKAFGANQFIFIDEGAVSQRCVYKGKQRVPIPGEKDYWIKQYHFPKPPAALPA